MSLLLPPSKNYQSPLNAVPIFYGRMPREGAKMIPVEIDWATMGGTGKCVSFNLQNNAYLEFSQIVAVSVDNSQCGADIQFIFPDTSETLTIPAYSPKTIIEVFTNQTQFYVSAPNSAVEDITRFSIHNSLPPPISVPVTLEQNAAAISGINIAVTGSSQIVPTTINGTIESLQVAMQSTANNATVSRIDWLIIDGAGTAIAAGVLTNGPGANQSQIVYNGGGLQVRFQTGIVFSWSSNANTSSGVAYVNLYYRTP